ncbi:hypothetical protein BDF14DRAFT_738357 [Spinellus fusiger]|nr:hypothetical protein BDF14DRAFT_738357 [Spinellus fusiger]
MLKSALIPIFALVPFAFVSVVDCWWDLVITEPKNGAVLLRGKNYTAKWTLADPDKDLGKGSSAKVSIDRETIFRFDPNYKPRKQIEE